MPRSLTVDETCQLLLALLSSGYPTLDKVAGLLHFSPRSLQRRFSKEGGTYAELVNRCRFKEAQRLLTAVRGLGAGYYYQTWLRRSQQFWQGIFTLDRYLTPSLPASTAGLP